MGRFAFAARFGTLETHKKQSGGRCLICRPRVDFVPFYSQSLLERLASRETEPISQRRFRCR